MGKKYCVPPSGLTLPLFLSYNKKKRKEKNFTKNEKKNQLWALKLPIRIAPEPKQFKGILTKNHRELSAKCRTAPSTPGLLTATR